MAAVYVPKLLAAEMDDPQRSDPADSSRLLSQPLRSSVSVRTPPVLVVHGGGESAPGESAQIARRGERPGDQPARL
jgi:hypothetical protein